MDVADLSDQSIIDDLLCAGERAEEAIVIADLGGQTGLPGHPRQIDAV